MSLVQERITALAGIYREQARRIRRWGPQARELQRKWERECRRLEAEA